MSELQGSLPLLIPPSLRAVRVLRAKTTHFRHARDLLLKPISGEVDIEHMDVDVGGEDA